MLSKTIRNFSFAAAAAIVLASGIQAASIGTTGWTRVSPSGWRFSALMPVAPEYSTSPVNTVLGTITMHSYQALSGNYLYQVSIGDYPIVPSNPRATLDGVRDGVVKNGRLLEEKEVSVNGYPGRTVKIEKDNWTIYDRFFLVKNRLYQVMFVMPKSNLTPAAATVFLNSFQLTQ